MSFLHDVGRRIADVSGKTIPGGAALTGKAQSPMVDSCIGQMSVTMMRPDVGNFGPRNLLAGKVIAIIELTVDMAAC